jgi:large subunit ribosomal protein L18
MIQGTKKNEIRVRIHQRIRAKVRGTPQRPRLAVFRSLRHIYAQVIDDTQGLTLVAASSSEESLQNGSSAGEKAEKPAKGEKKSAKTTAGKAAGGNVAGAKLIGKTIAERAKEKGIQKVVFDRGGYIYHGRVKALADAAREAGLEF